MKKIIIILLSLFFIKTQANSNDLETAIKKTKLDQVQELLKNNKISELQRKKNLDLAKELIEYRRQKSLLQTADTNKTHKNYRLKENTGWALGYFGGVGMYFSIILATLEEKKKEKQALGLFIGSSILTALGAYFIKTSLTKKQILQKKYKDAIEIKNKMLESI